MNLKKMERYLRVNLSGPGPRLMKKEFTGPRSQIGRETLWNREPSAWNFFIVTLRGPIILTGWYIFGKLMHWLRYIQTDVIASDSHHEPQKVLSCYLGEGTNTRLLLEFNLFLQIIFPWNEILYVKFDW